MPLPLDQESCVVSSRPKGLLRPPWPPPPSCWGWGRRARVPSLEYPLCSALAGPPSHPDSFQLCFLEWLHLLACAASAWFSKFSSVKAAWLINRQHSLSPSLFTLRCYQPGEDGHTCFGFGDTRSPAAEWTWGPGFSLEPSGPSGTLVWELGEMSMLGLLMVSFVGGWWFARVSDPLYITKIRLVLIFLSLLPSLPRPPRVGLSVCVFRVSSCRRSESPVR